MAKGDRFYAMLERKRALKKAEAEGLVADSMDVRTKIVERIHSGEITLEQGQAELKAIKRAAKKNGMLTRTSAYRG